MTPDRSADLSTSKAAARRASRRRRLGPDAACVACGERRPEALKPLQLLERHHPLGRAHDPALTIVLCLTHHAIATESLRREGVPMGAVATPLEREIVKHRARAVFFRDWADAEDRSAEVLERFMARLDAGYPGWRQLLGKDET